jgi:hypothetical protein
MRAAVLARLEEIRFRTAMAVLAGVLTILGLVGAVVITVVHGGPPVKAPPSLAGPAPFAGPPHMPRLRPASPHIPGKSGRPAQQPSTVGDPGNRTTPGPTPSPSHAISPPAIQLTSSPDPANPGQNVTYTVTMNPAPGTGTVAFADGGLPISGCDGVSISARGTAVCQVSYPRAGMHTITVSDGPGNGRVGPQVIGETVAHCGQSYQGCNLAIADLQNAILQDDNLARAILQSANLSGANLDGADLSRANLAGANLAGASVQNVNLAGAILTGANLSGMAWSNTTCPDGTNSNKDKRTCQHHL